jgi:hypothetical protein
MADDDEAGGRMEKTFLEKVTGYLKKGAVLVWVIPYKEMSDISTVRFMANNYETIGCWKFRESEYAKWHQVVYVGRKTDHELHLAPYILAEAEKYKDIDLIPTLPESFYGTDLYESVEVFPSDPSAIKQFAEKVLDTDAVYRFLSGDVVSEKYKKAVNRRLSVKRYQASDLGRPPIPPKKDSLYLLATSGAGQGIAGEKGIDLHLQRGVAEVVEDIEYVQDPSNPDKDIMKVTSHTQVTMTLIQTNGEITTLQ